jgi:hypothetical protein
MSRSNPTENSNPNPAVRWFEWNGEKGTVRYYDKDAKQNVEVGSDFRFILLDQLGSVRGWHDASDSGIYSNEVKDTRQETLIVKSFKGGTLAEGIYRDIKDRINSLGGQFVTNCYIAFKNGGDGLSIGSLRFKGAALGSWMEFCKAHRADLYAKAIRIHGFTEGKKGRIVFRMPVLEVADLSAESNAAATALDAKLQEFFAAYLKRPKREQEQPGYLMTTSGENDYDEPENVHSAPDDDDIPFAWPVHSAAAGDRDAVRVTCADRLRGSDVVHSLDRGTVPDQVREVVPPL